jgi:antitoxin PrlF
MVGSKITSKGQTTIPKRIRDELGLEPGDRVQFVLKDGEVVLHPIKSTLLDLRGSIKPIHRPEDFGEVRQEVKRQVTRKAAHE